MRKIISLLLALCMLLAALPVWAEETDLLDLVFDGIENFDPQVDQLLEAPDEGVGKYTAKQDIPAPYLSQVNYTYDEIGNTVESVYVPCAAMILDTLDYLGVSYEDTSLKAYTALVAYYQQLLVILFDYTDDIVLQLWWTPGDSICEAYSYGTVEEFLNEHAEDIEDTTELDNATLTTYVNQLQQGVEREPLQVGKASFRISDDKQSIFIDKPSITGGSGDVTIAYNIYDADSQPVNYFFSTEEHVAATPGYGGSFNVFIVVKDTVTHETDTQNIGWQDIDWPYADTLTVGEVTFEISPDGKSVFINKPTIACKGGDVTIAYNIYDEDSNPVNYFYSTLPRVAATPGYTGKFNVYVVVTDTVTGEQHQQDIGWHNLLTIVEPTCRALVVSNTSYTGLDVEDSGNHSIDGDRVNNILQYTNKGAYKDHIVRMKEVTAESLHEAINTAFSGATQDDVSLFYIASYADAEGNAVYMSDGEPLPWATLAGWLSEANPNNKVIVMIEANGSGSTVTALGNGEMDDAQVAKSITGAFAAANTRITVRDKVKDELGRMKLGELRTNKFEVLAACAVGETTVGSNYGSQFTLDLVGGIGMDQNSARADANNNGYITTQELYEYIYYGCVDYGQHPMVWPTNSEYRLFFH